MWTMFSLGRQSARERHSSPARDTTRRCGGCRPRDRPAGAKPSSVRARVDVEGAALGVEVDAAAIERRLDAERHAHHLAEQARRSRTATPAGAAAAASRPAPSRSAPTSSFERRVARPGEDVGAARRAPARRRTSRKPFDEIVDVGEVIEDLARARASESGRARGRGTSSGSACRPARRCRSAAPRRRRGRCVAPNSRASVLRLRAWSPGRRRPG